MHPMCASTNSLISDTEESHNYTNVGPINILDLDREGPSFCPLKG